jgi:hypothetical protein
MTMKLIFSFIMIQYGLAEDTTRPGTGKPDVSLDELYSQSAIYVTNAHALKSYYSESIYIYIYIYIYMHMLLSLPYAWEPSLFFSYKLPWLIV